MNGWLIPLSPGKPTWLPPGSKLHLVKDQSTQTWCIEWTAPGRKGDPRSGGILLFASLVGRDYAYALRWFKVIIGNARPVTKGMESLR